MRKILANIIFLAIIVLIVVGFKSYVIYYYEPVENNIHIGSKVNILYDKTKPNHKLEALSFYLDESFITNDYGETYKKSNTQVEVTEQKTNEEVETEKEVTQQHNSGTITFEIKHNVIENIATENKKLQKVDKYFLMKYSNLNNEIDLVNYYIKNKEKDSKIIDLIYQIKTKYLSSIFIKEMDLENEVKELSGLEGYLLKDKQNTKAIIFHQGNSYEVIFSEEFTEEDIIEVLNTFNFE